MLRMMELFAFDVQCNIHFDILKLSSIDAVDIIFEVTLPYLPIFLSIYIYTS